MQKHAGHLVQTSTSTEEQTHSDINGKIIVFY